MPGTFPFKLITEQRAWHLSLQSFTLCLTALHESTGDLAKVLKIESIAGTLLEAHCTFSYYPPEGI